MSWTVLLLALGLTYVGWVFQSWKRLRHVPGPFFSRLSIWWLVKVAVAGRYYRDMKDLTDKHGKYPHAISSTARSSAKIVQATSSVSGLTMCSSGTSILLGAWHLQSPVINGEGGMGRFVFCPR
jgi:hypothetical protein